MGSEEGARLFLGRAAAAAGRLASSARDRAEIEPLVKLLDGLPLAIELAAARSRVMSPKMLLERMKERFTLLATRGGASGPNK
jgi:predicted ATPase